MAALGLSPDPKKELTVERIGELFPALNARLGGLAVPVEILVVGGAAVAMQWNPRRATYDVDMVNAGIPQMFWDAVAAVAEAEGLGVHWLNNAAKVAVPTGPVPGSPSLLYQGSNLAVYGASAHMLMAMKLRSGRDIDIGDMPTLIGAIRPQSIDELYDLFEQAYPHHPVPPTSRRIIENVWADYAAAHPELVPEAGAERRDHRVYLSVQPATNLTAGWDLTIRAAQGLALRGSGLYPTREDAEGAARFAADVVDVHYPLRFAGSPLTHDDRAGDAVRVSVAAAGNEHRLVATAPGGELVAYSDPHTAVGAYNALAFVEALSGLVGDPQGRRAMRVTVDETCDCPSLGKGPCGHHPPSYLEVRPAGDADWGWTLAVCKPDGTPVATSGRYPSEGEAVAAGDFALEVVGGRGPLRFGEWEHGWEYDHRPAGDEATTVRPVPVPGGWQLGAYRPDGGREAASHTYPTHQAAAHAQDFLRAVDNAQPQRYQIVGDCGCEQRRAACRHGEVAVADTNPVSVVVRPHRESPQGWELAVRGADGSPLRVSDPYPSEADAVGARDFALRVVNGEYPIRFEGWNPWEWQDAPGYAPPSVEDAAVTVRVVSPPPSVPDDWRLEARRSTGYVVVTSRPYPAYPSADGALDFVGSLAALAGDPQRTGRVKDTTQPDDRVCDCRTLQAACLHFDLDGPDNRGPDRDDRGPYLGL